MAPRWPKKAPIGAQEGPKSAQERSKRVPRDSFEGSDGGTLKEPTPCWTDGLQDGPKRAPKAPKKAPRAPQEAHLEGSNGGG